MLQQVDDQGDEEIGGLPGAEGSGEIVLDAVLFHAAEGGIGHDDVDPVPVRIVPQGAGQGVVVPDVGGRVDAVEDHVGDAEHIGQGFLIDAADGGLEDFFVRRGIDEPGTLVFDHMGEKAAGAAGRVQDGFMQLGIHPIHDEPGHGPGGVELARIAGALEVLEDLFVDVAEGMAVVFRIEIDLADLVDHLAHQGAGFHVVVGVRKDVPDDEGAFAMHPLDV